jgi:hypothetical protein
MPPARGKAKNGPGKTGFELVACWPDPPILSLTRRSEPKPHCGNGQFSPTRKRKYPACVAMKPRAANVRFTPESGHWNRPKLRRNNSGSLAMFAANPSLTEKPEDPLSNVDPPASMSRNEMDSRSGASAKRT